MTAHKFVHIEISSHNDKEMKDFYGAALGWKFMDFPDMNYTTFSPGEGQLGGGLNPISDENPAGTILLYIHTDNLKESKDNVSAAGGNIIMDSLKIPGVGEMAVFSDPAGNRMALLQPETDM